MTPKTIKLLQLKGRYYKMAIYSWSNIPLMAFNKSVCFYHSASLPAVALKKEDEKWRTQKKTFFFCKFCRLCKITHNSRECHLQSAWLIAFDNCIANFNNDKKILVCKIRDVYFLLTMREYFKVPIMKKIAVIVNCQLYKF